MMPVSGLELHATGPKIEAEWDALAVRVGVAPFLRPGWICAWWRAFGGGELNIAAMRREGQLVGVLPTVQRRTVVSAPTNWHSPIFDPIAEDPETARRLLAHLLERRPRRIDLGPMDPDGLGLPELRKVADSYRIVDALALRSPFVRIEGDWDSYLASLSSNHRQAIRRTRRRLEEMGEVTLEISRGEEDLEALLDEGFELESRGWKTERGTAILSRPETRRFYRDIVEWARLTGILRLAFLRLDGSSIAFNLALETDRVHYLLKPGYDPRLSRLGPGRLLTADLIERAFRRGLSSYEFLGGAEPYKLRWTDRCRDRYRVQLFASTPAGWADRQLRTRGRSVAKRLTELRR
jgi:CelD/BcsL family acetyltransferase involved in cellulose biosynthesis